MKRSDIRPMPEYYDRYIVLVEDIELMEAFVQSQQQLAGLDMPKLRAIGDKTYAPGKWTGKDIFQHLIDTERVFSYRALRFARNDQTPLPGFEQDDYTDQARANQRSIDDLLSEYWKLRESTMAQFKSFDEKMLMRLGKNANIEISVLGQGFTIIGHQMHHLKVLADRYLALLGT